MNRPMPPDSSPTPLEPDLRSAVDAMGRFLPEEGRSLPEEGRYFPKGWFGVLLASLLAASLGAAFLNLSTATLRRAGGLVSLERILLALASSFLVALVLHICLSLVSLLVTRLTHRRRFIPMVIWSDLTVLSIATLAPVWDLVNGNLPSGGWAPAERLMTSTAIWATAFTLPLIGAAIAAAFRRKRHIARTYQAWLLTAPLLGLQLFVFVWLQVHGVSGMLSKGSLLLTLLLVLGVVGTLAAGSWLTRHVRPLTTLGTMAICILLAPVPGLLSSDRPRTSAQPVVNGTEPMSCVVLLTVDTLRADSLGALHPEIDTPASPAPELDALVNDSIYFTQARSTSPWTKPAAASILTGVAPEVHGANTLRSVLPPRIRTLAEYLQDAGFTTAGIGRNTFLRHSFNFDQGFDEYNFFPRDNSGILGDRLLRTTFPRAFATEPTTEDLTDFAIHWLERHAEEKFFLWLHYFDPHGPFAPPTEFLPQMAMPPRIGDAFSDAAAIRSGELVPDLVEREWIRQLYLAEVRYVSQQIGRVLEQLRELERYDECLLIFTSDHGEEFWEHGGFEHGHTLYDELLRVPFSIRLPDAMGQRPRRIDAPVSTASITPTVLDLLGRDVPERLFSSPPLRPLWQSAMAPTVHPPIFASGVHYFEDRQAVLFGHHKYIRVPLIGQKKLFDLSLDPGETRTMDLGESLLVAEAEQLLKEHEERSLLLRRRLGIGEELADLDSATLQDLRSLGYLQTP